MANIIRKLSMILAAALLPLTPADALASTPALVSILQKPYLMYGTFEMPKASGENTAVKELRRCLDLQPIIDEFKEITANDNPKRSYVNIAKDKKLYTKLARDVAAAVQKAGEEASKKLKLAQNASIIVNVDPPDWRYMAAVMPSMETVEEFGSIFKISSTQYVDNVTSTRLEINVTFEKPLETAKRMFPNNAEKYMKLEFSSAYLQTVYNEHGSIGKFVEQELPQSMYTSLVFPLEGYTRLRKSWYAGRDNGGRRHTGMDIHAPADTRIYSCTAGRVLFVGSSRMSGNFVVVVDELGFEYHYYHMIRQTSFLKQGDIVAAGALLGHVGNTGNSSVNHLHLTIIAPNGKLVNPYPLIMAANDRWKKAAKAIG